jgi:hypothetical protein
MATHDFVFHPDDSSAIVISLGAHPTYPDETSSSDAHPVATTARDKVTTVLRNLFMLAASHRARRERSEDGCQKCSARKDPAG